MGWESRDAACGAGAHDPSGSGGAQVRLAGGDLFRDPR